VVLKTLLFWSYKTTHFLVVVVLVVVLFIADDSSASAARNISCCCCCFYCCCCCCWNNINEHNIVRLVLFTCIIIWSTNNVLILYALCSDHQPIEWCNNSSTVRRRWRLDLNAIRGDQLWLTVLESLLFCINLCIGYIYTTTAHIIYYISIVLVHRSSTKSSHSALVEACMRDD